MIFSVVKAQRPNSFFPFLDLTWALTLDWDLATGLAISKTTDNKGAPNSITNQSHCCLNLLKASEAAE